jgi:HAD superfamily hydrolase (TIGR01509 family)
VSADSDSDSDRAPAAPAPAADPSTAPASNPRPAGRAKACLVDVYETLFRYDFAAHGGRLAALAGADAAVWARAQIAMARDYDLGRLTPRAAMLRILDDCGIAPEKDLVAALVAVDEEFFTVDGGLYDDAIPFLQAVRDLGVKIALVSNCGADTRPMLTRLEVLPLADEAILSCEIGHAKPDREIYERALDALGVSAEDAVFVDDQPSYCEGALAVGIRPIQIARHGQPRDPRYDQVSALAAIPALL